VTASAPVRRARRHDPDRKHRILDVTLDVIAVHGVAGTTHRLIAAAADVSPGSLTYHFSSLDDLLQQAFQRHAEQQATLYERHFDCVYTRLQLVEAVTSLILGSQGSSDRDWLVTYELYLAALRNPPLRVITERWMGRSREVLQRYLDPVTARGVDALIEGLIMHMMLSTRPVSRPETRGHVERLLGDAPTLGTLPTTSHFSTTGTT